jgi:putative GTP pyrophosphokinase
VWRTPAELNSVMQVGGTDVLLQNWAQLPSKEFLDSVSYETKQFDKALKNLHLSKISLSAVLRDLMEYGHIIGHKSDMIAYVPYRVKTQQSAVLKYDKYLATGGQFLTCFNDFLGFRVRLPVYLAENEFPGYYRVVDLTKGKQVDDGYRAQHLYYVRDNSSYPIEVQIWSDADYNFNLWAHNYLYKYTNAAIGLALRRLYDKGEIKSEQEFMRGVVNNERGT